MISKVTNVTTAVVLNSLMLFGKWEAGRLWCEATYITNILPMWLLFKHVFIEHTWKLYTQHFMEAWSALTGSECFCASLISWWKLSHMAAAVFFPMLQLPAFIHFPDVGKLISKTICRIIWGESGGLWVTQCSVVLFFQHRRSGKATFYSDFLPPQWLKLDRSLVIIQYIWDCTV